MGISGLIPFLEKASSKINLKDISGSTVAVDTYCWLHRGAIACAEKLCRGEKSDVHINFCLKYVNLLLSHNIKPILVFDGQNLPAKSLTEHRRREKRNESKKLATEFLRVGNIKEARSHMIKSINITHEMALQLITECRKLNVDCIVAPYEADAQIAYLAKCNIAQYVITEDSDLTLFGCERIIFKLDLAGNGLLIESNKFYLAMGCSKEKYNLDRFRHMCILSGCDYLDSLPKIGLAKACKFMLMTEETNMKRALLKIPEYLKMKSLIVSDEYINGFLHADATFKHMFVYDALKRKMVRLNNLSDFETNIEFCSNSGHILDDEVAFQLALGNLDPSTLKQVDNWDPEIHFSKLNINKCKTSIWYKEFETRTPKQKLKRNQCALEFKKINFKTNDNTDELLERKSENDIVSLYSYDIVNTKRRRENESDDDSLIENKLINHSKPLETPSKNLHNPFVKIKNDVEKTLEKLNNSLLKSISPIKKNIDSEKDNEFLSKSISIKKIVKSRLFASNIAEVNLIKNNTQLEEENFEATLKSPNKNSINKDEQSSTLLLLSPPKINSIPEEKKVSKINDFTYKKRCINSCKETEVVVISSDLTETIRNKLEINKTPKTSNELNMSNGSFLTESKNEEQHIINDRGINKSTTKKTITREKKTKIDSKKSLKIDKNQTKLHIFGFQKRSSLK